MKILAVIPGRGKVNPMPFVVDECYTLSQTNPSCQVEMFWIQGGLSLLALFKDLHYLRKKVRESEASILHAHFGTITCVITLLAAQGRPVVVTFRGSDLQPSRYDGLLRNIGQVCCSYIGALFADYVICVSSDLRRKLWFRQVKVAVIPSGINLELFKPRTVNSARAELGYSENLSIVLFYSGAKLKQFNLAQKLIEQLCEVVPNLKLVALDGTIPRDKIPSYLNAANVLLFLSDREGSPNIVREANACNLPVVSFNVGDVAEQLNNVSPSYICGRDIQLVKESLLDILKIKQRSNGREHVVRYSHGVIQEKRLEIYRQFDLKDS